MRLRGGEGDRMDQVLFEKFCRIVYDKAGIHLSEGKEALVSARIGKRLRALGLPDAERYHDYLTADESGDELVHFLDSISTNYTYFLREEEHFACLAEEARRIADGGKKKLVFWSTASSSGEEPYSMAITLLSALEGTGAEFRLLATDLSTRVLAQAKRGVYEAAKLDKLTRLQRAKYFSRHKGSDVETYEVVDHVRQRIVFKRLNLAHPPFPMKGPFDAVFCRNVMIYFDANVRRRLLGEIERLLPPKGLLIVGHAESLAGLGSNLVSVRPSVYRKKAS
jgi:chemotaxis protein methyltransferase CheR